MRKIEYFNENTGEITEAHRDAVQWYRDGDAVTVLLNGKAAVRWVH